MLAEVCGMASRADKEELVQRIDRFKETGGIELDVERMLADLDADRRWQ